MSRFGFQYDGIKYPSIDETIHVYKHDVQYGTRSVDGTESSVVRLEFPHMQETEAAQ